MYFSFKTIYEELVSSLNTCAILPWFMFSLLNQAVSIAASMYRLQVWAAEDGSEKRIHGECKPH